MKVLNKITEVVKPIHSKTSDGWDWYESDSCPVCGENYLDHGQRFCSHCGSRLDWGDADIAGEPIVELPHVDESILSSKKETAINELNNVITFLEMLKKASDMDTKKIRGY